MFVLVGRLGVSNTRSPPLHSFSMLLDNKALVNIILFDAILDLPRLWLHESGSVSWPSAEIFHYLKLIASCNERS
jgi:hypothetical protein